MLTNEPSLINGGVAQDARGVVRFVNGFTFPDVKRFYHIEHTSSEVVRAFHGHLKEKKYVYVCEGTIDFCVVPIDGTPTTSKDVSVIHFTLSSDTPVVLEIPGGYANGFRAVTPHAHVLFFSNFTLEQSKSDDYRYDANYWGSDVWAR